MNNISNVGIWDKQRDRIVKLLKYGESINSFVKDAVEKKLKTEEEKAGDKLVNQVGLKDHSPQEKLNNSSKDCPNFYDKPEDFFTKIRKLNPSPIWINCCNLIEERLIENTSNSKGCGKPYLDKDSGEEVNCDEFHGLCEKCSEVKL